MTHHKTNIQKACKHFFCIALLGVAILATGCGKTGMPKPKDGSESFEITSTEATPSKNCLTISGLVTGAFRNLDALRLEVSAINGPEDCPGCPFVPSEVEQLSRKDINLNLEDGSFGFTYCPQKAPAYRWRVAGISKYNTIPNSVTFDKMVIMPAK